MTAGIEEHRLQETTRPPSRLGLLRRVLRLRLRAATPHVFTSLTRRIIILNLAALLLLVSGILFLNQFRAGLIEARVDSLRIQGEIIAGAIAASATVDVDSITIDPEELLDLQVGQSASAFAGPFGELDFSINPERVAPVLRRLISPTGTRARIYDRDGAMIMDSRHLYSSGRILRFDLPPPEPGPWYSDVWRRFNAWLSSRDLPLYQELGGRNGRGYEEVASALDGASSHVVRKNETGELLVSVAVPIQRFRSVHGVLLLSTQGGDIDDIVYAERLAIIRVFLVAVAVTTLLSFMLAGTIAAPLRRLADAADRVRHRVSARPQIPDFTARRDEIGHLSQALREMTSALFKRIAAIENFAADVAHEIKNPLTSLRSAVETLPLAKTDEERNRLSEVIQHDIRRLDRLISDISDASRLDAELVREEALPVDLRELLTVVAGVARDLGTDDEPAISLTFDGDDDAYTVLGHDGRLGQVFNNLIDNARSFSRKDGEVRIVVSRRDDTIRIAIEDNGPGIREDQFERIFERFYTDRADTSGFGQNSGLGLSISKQIVEAHGGTIEARNMIGESGSVTGACFTVCLPTVREAG